MTLLDRIKSLCDSRGETLASLERKMDFGNGTIRRWDKTTPSGDKLAKVADYFNVTVDSLLGRTVNTDQDEDLDAAYTILSRNAKNLSPEKRKQLLDVARIIFRGEFEE